MTTEELLHKLQIGTELSVQNTSFVYSGKATLSLAGGEVTNWLFGEDGEILSVNPQTEEIVFYRSVEDEIEEDEEGVVYRNESFERLNEEVGTVDSVDEEAPLAEADVIRFTDFEGEKSLLRRTVNEGTGEGQAYSGIVVVEEDIWLA